MLCKYCGGELVQELRSCTFCGKELFSSPEAIIEGASLPPLTSADQKQKTTGVDPASAPPKSKGRYLLFGIGGTVLGAILLAVILFATGIFSFDSKKIEGTGYDTPEEAAEAYLKALKEQDLDAMIATFAVESYVQYFDFDAMIERYNSYLATNPPMPYPNTGDYTMQLNIAARRDQIARQISMQYLYYTKKETLSDSMRKAFADEEEMQNFIAEFKKDTENYVFEDLKITGTTVPEDLEDIYLNEQNQKNIASWAIVLGVDAEDIANVVITFEADGKTWVFCPQLVRYDNRWYLDSLTGKFSMILSVHDYAGGIFSDEVLGYLSILKTASP